MKLRAEVVEGIAAAKWSLSAGAEDEPYLLALVELGVRLALERAGMMVCSHCAAGVRRTCIGTHAGYSAFGGTVDMRCEARQLLALTPVDILQAQPGAEGESR